MEDIVVVGGGGHAKVVISILRKLPHYRILGYTDLKNNGVILRVPYLGSDQEVVFLAAGPRVLNAALAVGQVGLGQARSALWSRLHSETLQFPSIISPNAIVNEDTVIGECVTVMDGAVINTGATIGCGSIVNTNATIEHDVSLGEWVHIAPGVTISGGVKVGSLSMIGTGANVIEGLSIAPGCIIGAGTTVLRNIDEPGVYVGSPARRIR